PLKYMPFGLNPIKILSKNHKIDLFLGEERTQDYNAIFNENVNVFFLDKKIIWERPGKVNYLLLKNYFLAKYVLFPKKYDVVFGVGQAGACLASLLANRINAPFIYLNDEFPEIYRHKVWQIKENESVKKASFIIVPDETRIEPLRSKMKGIDKIPFTVLPNAPLLCDLQELTPVNWLEYFSLPPNAKIFLLGGGVIDINQIAETLVTVPLWKENFYLIVNGGNELKRKEYAHLDNSKIIWNYKPFDDKTYHSLIKSSVLNFGLYRNTDDLEFVGKSSGKIMRSLALGVPVIASNFNSLSFIREYRMGELVSHPLEIPSKINTILENYALYQKNCVEQYPKISYESYWQRFVDEVHAVLTIKF
ncbi:MAG: hypothetical protein NZ521_04580, partial [Flammeovirgaceae bacterium]|nr:hypothetical protein [Flammeovirgaceae bacterium]